MNNKIKFYNQSWFMWLTLILFAPVGIFLLWKQQKFSKKSRSILSGIFALWFLIFAISANNSPGTSNVSANKVTKVAVMDGKKNVETKKVQSNTPTSVSTSKLSTLAGKTNTLSVTGQLKVHYINVGQGDSELIQCNGKNMLIDTGTNASTSSLMSYLQAMNIKKIDVLVLTHPHEDHIGGADAVIKGFDIGTLYMNKVTTTTKTYKDVITAISAKGLKPIEPTPGATFKLGDASCTILSPINTNSKDLNTYSIVIKVTFGNNKFLFTGDTQASNEQDMLNKGYDVSADVLKVAHHGSSTSTSDAFLSSVNPKFAVISCGKGNDYGHPHEQTMDKLKAKSIPVYRTDENGTIVATSNGKNITFSTNAGDYTFGRAGKGESVSNNSTPAATKPATTVVTTTKTPAPALATSSNENVIVYKTTSGSCYHMDGCKSLSKSKIKLTLKEAKAEGLRSCKICNPPQ